MLVVVVVDETLVLTRVLTRGLASLVLANPLIICGLAGLLKSNNFSQTCCGEVKLIDWNDA